MSIWTRIAEVIAALAKGEGLSALFDRVKTRPERTVAFAIAVIGLGAKIAKADGQVTRDEVAAFREVFHIPPGEEANAARVYDLARQDVAGFEEYARKIRRMYGDDTAPLVDLIEGLFHIAVADGDYHHAEDAFLLRVATIFGFDEHDFRRMRALGVPDAEQDPWEVLGVARDAPQAEVRAAWRKLVRDTHPDQLQARGLPPEAIRLAEKRLVAVNRAWAQVHGGG
jgi:DnaJ like chaperone protein